MKQADDGSRRCFLKASSMLGLAVALGPATIGEAFADSKSDERNTLSESTATQQGGGQAADKTSIRPFHVNFPEVELTDLRRRVNATTWPERETVTDSSQGVQFETTQKLARYWANDHDWRKCEAKLNAVPQFFTEIDGLDIHFVHARSKNPNAVAVISSLTERAIHLRVRLQIS
jgi:hypothetical protein